MRLINHKSVFALASFGLREDFRKTNCRGRPPVAARLVWETRDDVQAEHKISIRHKMPDLRYKT
jgi:hypothetical protein